MSAVFAGLQKLAPQHGLSRLMGRLAASETPWLKTFMIEQFARVYRVTLDEAEREAFSDYHCFNDFFTRSLKSAARPLATQPGALVCPADGTVSQLGTIVDDQLLQAKGHSYTLTNLAGELSEGFINGSFCTIYLAPSDYHRVHLPTTATLEATLAVPGALFSVNGSTEQAIPGLFAVNERLVCRFTTEFGPMLVVLVGAMIVASIETDWAGPTSPYLEEELSNYHLVYERGEEIGRFLLGSTVICCFPKDTVEFNGGLTAGSKVRMGQQIASLKGR
jgi:phosphatidylserine decarboxylase